LYCEIVPGTMQCLIVDISIVSHSDWNFPKRLKVGESAIIYKGELVVQASSHQFSVV